MAVITASLGALGVAIGGASLASHGDPHIAWTTAPALLALLTAAGYLMVRIQYRDQGMSIDLTEAVLAPAIFALPAPVVIAIAGLGIAGRIAPSLADKAELARIGRYYATESMLVLDPVTGRYDADATPSTGSETLFDYYAQLIRGEAMAERGDHAVF